MKKSLIALAALAATGAAMAQSSVTLYGIVDAYVGSVKDTTSSDAVKKERQSVVNSGGLKSSRWGIKGSEDLGGGLKAGFTLEQGINVDSGTANKSDKQFDRAANVNLSGAFGTVLLGRSTTPYDSLRADTNLINDYNLSPIRNSAGVYQAAGMDYTDRLDNVVAYASPNFNGFSGSVAVGLGENKTAAVSAANATSLQVRYANGPLLVGYGFQKEKAQVSSVLDAAVDSTHAATGNNEKTFNLLTASYDLGVAKLVGNYQTGKSSKYYAGKVGDEKGYALGVSAPVAPKVNVYFGYAHAKYDDVTVADKDIKSSGYTLAATYSLSKRTDLYAGYKQYKKENDNTGADLGKSTTLALGVRHNF